MTLFEKERKYLRCKYNYYIGKTEISDSEFDLLEKELSGLKSVLPNIIGSPTLKILEDYDLVNDLVVGEKELRFNHPFPMLSLKKYTVDLGDDLGEKYPEQAKNFFKQLLNKVIFATPKFDGNSMELIYINGKLNQAITRGEEDQGGGLDRTEKLKLIVPNQIDTDQPIVSIRGEVIIQTELWLNKYSNPKKVDNPRNWIAGLLNKDDFDDSIIKDCEFIGYQITYINNGLIRPNNQLELIQSLGFTKVFQMQCSSYDDFFTNIYKEFKQHRIDSVYALDGIVLNFEPNYWQELGEGNHHPNWACAIKFPANSVETQILNIIWNLGKDGELTPVAILKPVELDGVIVRRASLHNLGWIIDKEVFIGAVVKIAKKGEIIPQVIDIVSKSPQHEDYLEYISEFIK